MNGMTNDGTWQKRCPGCHQAVEPGPETHPVGGGASHTILSVNGLQMNKPMSAMSVIMEIKKKIKGWYNRHGTKQINHSQ
jgi:hypothetical protein